MKYLRPVAACAALLLVSAKVTRAQPANDDLVRAVSITALPFAEERDTTGATPETPPSIEPQPTCLGGSQGTGDLVPVVGGTVWYRLVVDREMTVSADTEGSDYNTMIAAYVEAAPGIYREVACDAVFEDVHRVQVHGGEHISFEASPGQTYYLQLGDENGGSVASREASTLLGTDQGGGGSLRFRAYEVPGKRIYVTMSDGVELAVYLSFPPGWDGPRLPAIFEYDGYGGGGAPISPLYGLDRDHYVFVHGGVRGAGCSGGQFSVFSRQSIEDGAALVEWIASQPWSDGNVGLFGHSYSGHMAAYVAAERPPHLRAATVSNIEADFFRDLSFPGGVANAGFTLLWHAAIRPRDEHLNGTVEATRDGDPECAAHIASRPPPDMSEPDALRRVSPEDSEWWRQHALVSVIGKVEVPFQISGVYQDEQILGRGPAVVWQSLAHDRKQLILTNGDHNTWQLQGDREVIDLRQAWLDRYLRGIHNGIDDHKSRVHVLLETQVPAPGTAVHSGTVTSEDFPLFGTRWMRLYARDGRLLSEEKPQQDGSDVFLGGSRRQLFDHGLVSSASGYSAGQEVFWSDGPDTLTYRSAPATSTRVIAGPIVASLWARVYGADAEVYVMVADEDGDGNRSLLQRGLLRASHRLIDPARSWFDGDVMYRPWRPHTNPTLLTPGEPVELDVEVWPVAFVQRPGHRIVMTITSPPAVDGYQIWEVRTLPAPIEILRDPQHATNLLLPIVDPPTSLGPEPACGAQVSVKCAKPVVTQ